MGDNARGAGWAAGDLDAWRQLLGVDASADAESVISARRRLAKELHPDAGGDQEAMRSVNVAADALLAALAAPAAPAGTPSGSSSSAPARTPDAPGFTGRKWTSGPGQRADHDVASFTIEALPAEAFEALLVVTSWIGEIVVDEPPYQLDVLLTDPLRCWCRLDLVPDAGASTVGIAIAALPDEPLPDIDSVRDLWVGCLNHLGPDRDVG